MRCMALFLAGGLVSSALTPVMAQAPAIPQSWLPQNGGVGVRTGHITATGETVPDPGVANSAGTTERDREIQKRDNAIDGSICKGC